MKIKHKSLIEQASDQIELMDFRRKEQQLKDYLYSFHGKDLTEKEMDILEKLLEIFND